MRPFLPLLLIAMLSACVAQQAPVPQENYFRLEANVANGASGANSDKAARLTDGLLMVEELRADSVHAERALIYSDDKAHRKLKLYNYDFWSDPPTRLIQGYLVQRLRAASVASQVMRYDINDSADLYLGGRVERFAQLINGNQASVEVELELRLSVAGERRPLLLQSYAATVAIRGTDPADTVAGYEQALNRIIARFLADARAATGTVR